MRKIFFYGLFMDEEILKTKGIHPTLGKIASAIGYGLRIGERATLVKSDSEHCYGIVMALSENDLCSLYSNPEVSEYIREQLEVCELSGQAYIATTYILPASKLSGSNRDYAKALSVIATKKGLPQTYIDEILGWAK